jgi:hypothetical protein
MGVTLLSAAAAAAAAVAVVVAVPVAADVVVPLLYNQKRDKYGSFRGVK